MPRIPVEKQIESRLPLLMHVYPGLTPRRLGRLSFNRWARIRDWADEWDRGRNG